MGRRQPHWNDIAQSDPIGVVGPVRYLTDALLFVSSLTYEAAVDELPDECNGHALLRTAADKPALRAQVHALGIERGDPNIAAWRRMEARLGFDPDEAPDEVHPRVGRLLSSNSATTGWAKQRRQPPVPMRHRRLNGEIQAARASQN